jgi:uncharacterized protein
VRELVEFLAKSLVDEPENVRVTERERDRTTVLELRVAPADLGKVIGRQGRTARAMRSILSAAASRGDERYILDILD